MRVRRTITLLGFIAIAAAAFSTTAIPAAAKDGIAKRAAKGDLKPAILTTQTASGQTIQKQMPFLSDSTIISAKAALNGEDEDKDVAADAAAGGDFGLSGSTSTGSGPGALGCSSRDKGKGNKRVNQDCTFRRQAEESIAFNPANPVQLNAGQNDSRVGFNQCGIDFSTDNGEHWGDMLPPFRQRFNSPGMGVGLASNRLTASTCTMGPRGARQAFGGCRWAVARNGGSLTVSGASRGS